MSNLARVYHLDRAREWIAQLYRAWGKSEKAAEWEQELKSTKPAAN